MLPAVTSDKARSGGRGLTRHHGTLEVLVVLFVLAAAAAPARAQMFYTEVREYYDIRGETMAELRAEIDRLGPGEFAAYVKPTVNARYRFRYTSSECWLTSSRVDVEVTYLMPRWVGPPGPSEELRRAWRHYWLALKRHEDGHKNNWLRAGTAIQDALRVLPPDATCEALRKVADAAVKRLLERHKRYDEDYDKRTQHGRTQGTAIR
jgi:predicted secreted Zn-dependent protease